MSVTRPQPRNERGAQRSSDSAHKDVRCRLPETAMCPMSSAVSIPSRVIISSVKRNTPAHAFAPVLQRR